MSARQRGLTWTLVYTQNPTVCIVKLFALVTVQTNVIEYPLWKHLSKYLHMLSISFRALKEKQVEVNCMSEKGSRVWHEVIGCNHVPGLLHLVRPHMSPANHMKGKERSTYSRCEWHTALVVVVVYMHVHVHVCTCTRVYMYMNVHVHVCTYVLCVCITLYFCPAVTVNM